MSEQDETPEKLEDEQAAGGPPEAAQEELDEAAPTVADEASGDEPKAEAEAEEKPKPKPKRKPAAKKPKAEKAEEASDADEAAAEEKPKPKRKPAAKKDERGGREADEGGRPPEVEAEEPKEAPKPRRAEPSSNGQRQVVRAQARYVRTSARKARLVCDHLRGKSVDEARAILLHTPRHVARDWSKLLESAVANAEHNHELVGDELRILSITADEGPTIKRFRPRAMGRATRIRKRTAHLSIALTPKES